jgi:hypothetical protein
MPTWSAWCSSSPDKDVYVTGTELFVDGGFAED